MKIGIVGCGSTGLAAAAFLHDAGHEVVLFEQFTAPKAIGAGLLLQPTGLAVLARLGLDRAAIAHGGRIEHLYGRTKAGRLVFDLRYRDLATDCFGLGIHRGTLFMLLYEAVRARNIPIEIGHAITDSEITCSETTGETRWLQSADGRHGPFDLVVDASGYRSLLRQKHAEIRLQKPYPYGAVWAICEDKGQQFGGKALQQRYIGAHTMAGIMPVGRSPAPDSPHYVTFFWSLPVSEFAAWEARGLEAWKEEVRHCWPESEPILAQIHDLQSLTCAAYGDVVLKRWHAERLVFLGDAGHSMSPQLGQGANLGLVDAMTLADCLAKAPDMAQALAQYSRTRRRHLRFYQATSRLLTPFFQSESRMAAWVRDWTFHNVTRVPYAKREMLRVLAGIKTGPFSQLNPGDWHTDYAWRKRASKAAIA